MSSLNGANILDLPNEVFFLLFEYLSALDLLRLGQSCSRIRYLANDELIWQCKLTESLCHAWTAVYSPGVSSQKPPEDIMTEHPKDIYLFLANHVPMNQLILSNDKDIAKLRKLLDNFDQYEDNITVNNDSLKDYLHHFFSNLFNTMTSLIPLAITPTPQVYLITKPQARFALFGSGFDAIATNRLFARMLDNRTKSFIPEGMFIGFAKLWSGLTVRLTKQAQKAIEEEQYEVFLKEIDEEVIRRNKLARFFGPTFPQKTREYLNEDNNTDYIFDMVQLFSTETHLNHQSRTQFQRITSSRLFQKQQGEVSIENLKPVFDLTRSLSNLNGFIYAIDARNSFEELQLLRYELDALNLYIKKKSTWPILILYIMPKSVIQMNLETQVELSKKNLRRVRQNFATSNVVKSSDRDSFSGENLTKSWTGSLLDPIAAMRLFELENPWRLQRCASNDIKCLVKGIMWLKFQFLDYSGSERRSNF